ncbi:MAG: DUF1786 family protein [Candidatus Limnocylindrales bacterium]|jgi:uncharacterized protein (DUF1786 family)
MRALCIDVGTGTQDILLFDADREIENAVRFVLPAPTIVVAARVHEATRARRPLVLTGSTMGGGPSAWAIRDHALAGVPVAATADAARTLDDDLDALAELGVRIVDTDEAAARAAEDGAVALQLRDVALDDLTIALAHYDIDLRAIDALAVAVFDHGAAPPGISDRRFRFERLAERLAAEPSAGPAGFADHEAAIPAAFTRLCAATADARAWLGADHPASIVAMDTGPAAVLGALEDAAPRHALARGREVVAVNVGNFHTLAMRLTPDPDAVGGCRIASIYEHHTGELSDRALRRDVALVASGDIDGEAVFADMGHGALIVEPPSPDRGRGWVAVTGPRRERLVGRLVRGVGRAAPAVPHGDMMQAGPFGLLRALAWRRPEWRAPVERRLGTIA